MKSCSLFQHIILLRVCLESLGLRSKLLRKVEELRSDSVCSGIPDEFLCPITRELMREPVIAAGMLRLVPFIHIIRSIKSSLLVVVSAIHTVSPPTQMATRMKERQLRAGSTPKTVPAP